MSHFQPAPRPPDRAAASRNGPCPCGSGRKYKHCCGSRQASAPANDAPEAGATAKSPPSIGPLTEAGRFLERFSPVRQAMEQSPQAPTPRRAGGAPEPDRRSRQSAQAWLDLAARHEVAGNRDDAIAALQRAVRAAPTDPVAHFNLGLTCAKANRAAEAIASLRQAIGLRPAFGRAHFQLGLQLQGQGQDEEAIAAFRSAIALGANQRRANAALGELLQIRGDTVEAAACFRRAADNSTWGRLQLAHALRAEEKLDEAEAAVRRALALDPNSADAEWLLADIQVSLGRLDEATRHCDRAIALKPATIGAYYTRGLASRFTEADRPLIARMAAMAAIPQLSDTARMKMHYAAGKAFDDLKDYAAAIRHFDAANRIDDGLCRYDGAEHAAWVDLLIARCTSDYFARHRALGVDDETPVFVVGMPRSGTTLVEQILSSHPLVAGGGELEFWLNNGPPWEKAWPQGLTVAATHRLADDYRAGLRRIAPDALRVTDKLPHNFMWIGLIHLVFPRARIVHCRRNPVDTCLSIYFTQFLRRMSFACDRGNLVQEYRRYERIMAHWRAVLPPDRFLDVDYETLVADREAGTRRLIDFCGLDWDDACLRPESNRRVVMTASAWQARQPIYRSSVERWRNYEPWLGELRELLPPDEDGGSVTPPIGSSG